MQLISLNGTVIKEWNNCPTHFYFDTNSYPEGVYFLKIKTNLKTETHKIVFER
jgi:hypothetical protein